MKTEEQGRADCKAGIAHQPGQGEPYDLGWGMQYQEDQIASAQTFEPPQIEEYFAAERKAL